MKNSKLIYLIYIVLFSFLACEQNVDYNKMEWVKKEDKGNYPNRDKMLEDLVKNHKLKGLSYKELAIN